MTWHYTNKAYFFKDFLQWNSAQTQEKENKGEMFRLGHEVV